MDMPLDQALNLMVQASRDRNWALAAALIVLGVVWSARRVLEPLCPWLGTDRGGAAASLVTAWLGAVVSALATGQPINLELVVSALGVAATASGGWTLTKKLLSPS